MPPKRQATLTLDGPEDQTVTFQADFDQLTLTRTQVGGYQREPNGAKAFTSEAAAAFWKQLEALATKGLRDGAFDTLDAVVWKFKACDGKKTYEATGLLRDSNIIIDDDQQADDSYADLTALFALLKS
jgi:hypothetical protein